MVVLTGGSGVRRSSGSPLRRAIDEVRADLDAAIARDPAVDSRVEMALASPGLHAIWTHRVSHSMWKRGGRWKLPARMLSQASRAVTGVEIHPGAQIGKRFFIDHGMGVVIGETAEIGNDVMMYNGVNLGGRTFAKVKRHPTLADGVTVGAGARILGPVTVGAGSAVGANAVVVKDVPAQSTAVGVPAVVRPNQPAAALDPFADPALYI
ncbi:MULTISPECIES: serine O-acetyltransferase EpsC [Yimella]|uniref:Serine acetyltransferase n=1 Tax=Yimella lutea TaxID=587872 RepID=A0A542ED67_9MICO|nr:MULTISPECIES: serine O-acetyltransferase EpsC [Yimella]MCG8656514.1 serine O-acetyltransferase [Yimella sp. NH-Cas1]TQJ13250.1 serine O-acetyltransferase [Yimella lutea]